MGKKSKAIEETKPTEELEEVTPVVGFFDEWATAAQRMTGSEKVFLVLAVEKKQVRVTYMGTIPPLSSPDDTFTPFTKRPSSHEEYVG